MKRPWLAAILLLSALSVPGAGAEEPPDELARVLLAAHNRLRAEHCTPPLEWSNAAAAAAAAWIEGLPESCHAGPAVHWDYGTNTAWHGAQSEWLADEIVDAWHAEQEQYDFAAPGFTAKAGHFTQLVWAGTTHLGCVRGGCGDMTAWVCFYTPPGNELGEFDGNVLDSSSCSDGE